MYMTGILACSAAIRRADQDVEVLEEEEERAVRQTNPKVKYVCRRISLHQTGTLEQESQWARQILPTPSPKNLPGYRRQ